MLRENDVPSANRCVRERRGMGDCKCVGLQGLWRPKSDHATEVHCKAPRIHCAGAQETPPGSHSARNPPPARRPGAPQAGLWRRPAARTGPGRGPAARTGPGRRTAAQSGPAKAGAGSGRPAGGPLLLPIRPRRASAEARGAHLRGTGPGKARAAARRARAARAR
jgi:hypothetical protein